MSNFLSRLQTVVPSNVSEIHFVLSLKFDQSANNCKMQQTLFDTGLKHTMTDLSNDTNSKRCHLSEATTSTEGTSPHVNGKFFLVRICVDHFLL